MAKDSERNWIRTLPKSVENQSLAKVSNWNSSRVNQNYSEPMRIIPNRSEKRFVSRLMKNGQKSIRLIPQYRYEWIRTNPKPSFQSRSIRINLIWIDPNRIFNKNKSEWIRGRRFKLILIENSVWIHSSSDWFRLIWIENLVSDSFKSMSRN